MLENPFLLNFMNMHLPSLLIFFFVQTSYISHHKTTASPLLFPRAENGSSPDYYEGYPQREVLENKSLYLLGHLQGSRALSTTNLALWDGHYSDEEEACEAVKEFLEQQSKRESSNKETHRGCAATYTCDYNRYRFPSTIININCDSTRSFCETTQDNWPVRGSCLGDQYYLTTLQFVPDPASPSVQDSTRVDDDGSGSQSDQDITGSWIFQTSLRNKGCLCLSK